MQGANERGQGSLREGSGCSRAKACCTHCVDTGQLLVEQPGQGQRAFPTIARLDTVPDMGIDGAEGKEAEDSLPGWACPVLLALREDGEEDVFISRHAQGLGQQQARLGQVGALHQTVLHTMPGAADGKLHI